MLSALRWLGRLAGLGGILLALVAVLGRLGGAYVMGGFQTGTMLLAATFLMALACFAYVATIAESGRG